MGFGAMQILWFELIFPLGFVAIFLCMIAARWHVWTSAFERRTGDSVGNSQTLSAVVDMSGVLFGT